MTAAQKTAKANFKKAIEYRKKTGVSLKEAFAHVYGKKVGAAPKKKATKKAAPKKAAKKVVKKAAPKKVAKKAAPKKVAKKKHTKYGKVKAHTRRVAGTKIVNELKISDLKKGLEIISNEHPEWGSFIVDRKYDKGIWEITGKSGTRTLFEDEVKFWKKLPPKFTFLSGLKKKSAPKKSVSLHKDTKSHNVNIRVVSGVGKISQHNLDKIKSSLKELKQLETHLAILKNVKPKIVKTQLPVIRREIKNTVNSIKEIKTHIAQLKKHI